MAHPPADPAPDRPRTRPVRSVSAAVARVQGDWRAAVLAVGRHPWARRSARALGVLVVVLAGSALGAAMTPPVAAQVGPLSVEVRVVPSLDPGVHLLVPPAGRVSFDTHLAPVAVEAQISEVDLEKARALINSPGELRQLQAAAPDLLRAAAVRALLLAAFCTVTGAVVLALLVYRGSRRRLGQVAGTVTCLLVATATTTALTFDSDRFAQPRFEGLLSQAPYLANQTSSLVRRLESYRSGLADIVESVTTLYAKGGDLPALTGSPAEDVVTVLHISDVHDNPLGLDLADRLVRQFGVDVVVDTGDLTTWGTDVESATTISRIRGLKVPYVFVRGNHDSLSTQRAVEANPNAVVLDGRVIKVGGLVFAGLGDPRFTPDGSVTVPTGAPGTSVPPAGTTSSVTASTGGTGSFVGTTGAAQSTAAPSTAARAVVAGEDPELVEGRRLAVVVRDWNAAHPAEPVAVAAFHEPAGIPPLDGLVPLALAGHLHSRSVKVLPSGTRLMIEGTTGGAGFDSLKPSEGTPVPLTASVLYFARSGARAGQLLAYDEVTVGGFGLASVALERTVLRPDPENQLAPGQVRGRGACPSPSGSPPGSPPESGRVPAAASVPAPASASSSGCPDRGP